MKPRPALRYYGSKWRLAPKIISHFPKHQCYCEPFCGALGVLQRKPPSAFEIVNDLDQSVVNFFRVLREQPDVLLRAISLTPWSRAEQLLSYLPSSDPLESARRLYVRSWQTRGGPRTQWHSGWRYYMRQNGQRPPDTLKHWHDLRPLEQLAKRLLQVHIECDTAERVIARYDCPTTLFYLDPPYLPSVRGVRWQKKAYQHEMTAEDHVCLANRLHQIKGMAIISGYASPLYNELYHDWQVVSYRAVNELARPTVEYLWLSPNVVDHGQQLAMFAMENTST